MLTEEERFSIAEAAADADDDCLPTRAETLRSLLARSYAGEWIAVGERLPERNGNEMVMLFNGNLITFGSRSGSGGRQLCRTRAPRARQPGNDSGSLFRSKNHGQVERAGIPAQARSRGGYTANQGGHDMSEQHFTIKVGDLLHNLGLLANAYESMANGGKPFSCNPVQAAAQMKAAWLLLQQIPVWIPVSEQMPDENQCVLAYTDYGMHVASVNEYQQWGPNHGDGWDFPTVTHWMLLPPPPEAP
jgi:hypothetical protein